MTRLITIASAALILSVTAGCSLRHVSLKDIEPERPARTMLYLDFHW